jgi:hypothetical protein
MRLRNLVWSVTLGVAVTIGLLLGLSMISSSVVAASVDPAGEAVAQVGVDAAVRAQDTVSTAYVVVRVADNDVIVRAITFTIPISSYRALELAGLNPVGANTAWGLMLCGINGVGKALPDGSDCDNGTRYWSTSYWSNSVWVGYLVGAGDAVISQDGHIDGFSWSDPGWVAIDPPPAPPLTSASNALDWLRMQQQTDGSFGSPGSTAEALIAVGANRIDATTWRHSPSLLANVLANGVALANGGFDAAAGAGKLAIALAANEGCWPIDALQPMDHYSSTTGKFGVNPGAHAWAMMGTVALSQAVPASATQYLKSAQLSNGGWEWGEGWGDDTNSTALAIQALVAAGEPVTSTAIVSGMNYLDSAQNDDGGFPYSPTSMYGTDSDTNSTAYVVQALLAAESLTDTRWITYTGGITPTSPITFLLTMQLPDGSFEWQRGFGANRLATQQAIPALLHRPFPVKVAELDACYGISGRVMEGSVTGGGVTSYSNSDPMPDVTMWAQGANDLYFGTTISPTGYYTISVPIVGSYVLTPSKSGYVFSPTIRTVMVSGSPGDITGVEDFAGKAVLYLPLVIRS